MSRIKVETNLSIDTSLSKDELEHRIEETRKTLEQYQKIHEKKVLTRRDFLASGAMGFTATMMSQSLFSLLMPRSAKAAEMMCSVGATGEWAPLITLNLAGGAGLSANWMPLDQGGQMLPSYSKMGQGKAGLGTETAFSNNAPFFAGAPFLTGVKSMATPAAMQNSAFVGIAVRSQDDSGANHFDITGLARGMGLNGKLLANMGTSNTATGNNTLAAYLPPPAPLIVSRYEDITGALGVGGSLAPLVSSGRAGKMFEAIQKLSTYQAERLVQLNGGAQLQSVVTCRTTENTNLIANPSGNNTDPRDNAAVAQIWGLAANTSTSSENYQFGSMVYNAVNGNAGSVNLTRGGYDYHGSTRVATDLRDQEAGTVIGRIIQTCYALNKKAFILVTSDGSVTSTDSDSPGSMWASDGGLRGSAFMIAVNPAGAPSTNGSQLGFYVPDQAADDQFISSPDRAAAAMFVNYLSFNGKLSQIDQVLPRTLTPTDIEKMRMIA